MRGGRNRRERRRKTEEEKDLALNSHRELRISYKGWVITGQFV